MKGNIENTAAKPTEAGFLEILAQDVSNEVFEEIKTDLREKTALPSKRKESNMLYSLGMLAVITGSLLGGDYEMLAYLLLGLAIYILDLVEVKKLIKQRKVRVALGVSGAVIIGTTIQLIVSIGQIFSIRQISLLIILIGGLFIFLDGVRRYRI